MPEASRNRPTAVKALLRLYQGAIKAPLRRYEGCTDPQPLLLPAARKSDDCVNICTLFFCTGKERKMSGKMSTRRESSESLPHAWRLPVCVAACRFSLVS
jgi:hypothetical protein